MPADVEFRRDLIATIRLGLPLIVAQLSAAGQGVIEVMLAGHLDAHTLGAVAVGSNVVAIPLMTIIGILYAVPPAVAQLDGAGRRGEIAPVFRQALWLAAGLGVCAFAFLHWVAPILVARLGLAPDLLADVAAFLRASSFAMPGLAVFIACRGLSDGLRLPRPTMVLSLCGLASLGPIGWVMMYGEFGLPRLGAAGTGYAAALIDTVQAAAYLGWLAIGRGYRDVFVREASPLRERWRPRAAAIGGLLRVGVPMGASILLEVGLFSLAGLVIGLFGEIAAASNQIALNAASLVFMIPLGLAQAITVRVGHAVGRQDHAAARRAGLAGLTLVLVTQAASSSAMLGLSPVIAALYTPDAAVIAGAVVLLQIAGIFQFSDGIQVAGSGALRGLKDTRVPMFITGFAYWLVGMPLALLLAFGFGLRASGMWIGLTGGLTVAAALLFGRFLRLTRAQAPSPPRKRVSNPPITSTA